MPKVIDTTTLSYYNNKVSAREDAKIRALPLSDRNTYIKYFFEGCRDGKVYGVKFAYDANDVIQATSGVKYGANEGLVVEPSTRTVVGRDDYANINVFRGIDANVHLSDDGDVIIDYLQGDDGFSYTGKVNVVRIFPTLYERVYDEVETVGGVDTKWFHIEWTDTPRSGFTMNILCRDKNGKDKGFYCITKFAAGLIDNVLYASANIYPWVSAPSYSNCVDKFHEINDYQCAMTMSQMVWLQRVFMVKYAHTNYQKKLNGLTSYNYAAIPIQYTISNKNYLVVPTTDANNMYINTRLDVGTSATRSVSSRNIIDNTELLAKDSNVVLFSNIVAGFTIDNSDYTIASSEFSTLCSIPVSTTDAVDYENNNVTMDFTYNGNTVTIQLKIVVDNGTYTLYAYDTSDNSIGHSAIGDTTNTVLTISDNINATAGSAYMESSIYRSGYSLEILGNDGCYQVGNFAESNKLPSVISGVELLYGAYEVLGNVVGQYDANAKLHILVCNDLKKLTKTEADIDDEYTNIGEFTHTLTDTGWGYGSNIMYDLTNGCYTATYSGGSSTSGLCDGAYIMGTQTTVKREFLVFGMFSVGVLGGPFCVALSGALTSTSWNFTCRPSFVGNIQI